MTSTLYDRLSVSRDAPSEVIRAAYRVLSQRHHPDRNPGDAASLATMQAINDAYAVLSDPERRRVYDASLRTPTGTVASVRSQQAPPPSASTAAPRARARTTRRRVALAAAVALPLAGAGVGLWQANRHQAPVPAPPVRAPAEWRIHGVDSQGPRPPAPRPAAGRKDPGPEAGVGVANVADRTPVPFAPRPPVDAGSAPAPHPSGGSPLPIVADPNGRPWPLGAAYVAGLPQTHRDGLSAVVLNNAMNPAPVFVTLVALDDGRSLPVRHVHVPAMGAFRIDSVRPGRYEVQHRNLVTGALTRSEPFDLRQVEGRYGVQASERAVPLDPWATMRMSVSAGAH